MEWIGTIAFAVSGALIAVSNGLDLFGVTFLGCITAVGGGMLRDILLGQCPPTIFFNTPVLFVAALTSVIVFIVAYRNRQHFETLKEKMERINREWYEHLERKLRMLNDEIAFFKSALDTLPEHLSSLMKDMIVEGQTWDTLDVPHHIGRTTIHRYRRKAISILDKIYECNDQETREYLLS